jgi:membrane fusion protein, multidrug efflux system
LMPILVLVVVVLAASGVMWKMGKLPFGPAVQAADDVATAEADSAVVENEDEDKEEEVAVPVELALVGRRSIASYYKAASVIEADRLVDLVTKTQGPIQQLNVEEGDWVQKGQILAELQNDREEVQLKQAELRLQEQKRSLDRTGSMLEEGLISDQEYDAARSAYELAETDRDLAEIALNETLIRAPFQGQITERKVVLGQQVNMYEAVFTLADFQPMRVRVHLPEAVARKVHEGQRVLITPEAAEKDLEAVVERVSPVVDPVTSTIRLTLLVNNAGETARVGGFVKARITTDSHADALAIPKLALVEEGSMRSVFVAEADSVRKVEINTGLYDETYVEILDGVIDGQFVVIAGQGGLRTGTLIDALNGEQIGWGGKSDDGSSLASEADTMLALSEEK